MEQYFYKLKNLTEKKYKQVDFVYSKALCSKIVFNSNGFHHLRYDNSRKERSKKVQRSKFIFFDQAIKILKKSTTVQEYRRSLRPVGKLNKDGLKKTKIVEWFSFFCNN